jgi:hypothetical protein
MKNSNNTIWNRTSDLLICSTVPLPLSYRSPLSASVRPQIFPATLWSENLCCTLQGDAVLFTNFQDYCHHLSYDYTHAILSYCTLSQKYVL